MSNAISYTASDAVSPSTAIPKAKFFDTLSILFGVFLPTIAKGVIVRRPTALALADRLNLDTLAVRIMQRLRSQYGSGPVLLHIPGRTFAVIIDPGDVHRILAESPIPFATATPEKTAALAHFEPKVALISSGAERADRRRYNEEVLEPDRAIHCLANHFAEVVASEATQLRRNMQHRNGTLNWSNFSEAWFSVVRRVIFGDAARTDTELSSMMAKLRFAANWAFLRPQRQHLREQLLSRIKRYLENAYPNSLSEMMAPIPTTAETFPEQQVTQWLFAFDAAGMATFRSLALLATHPEQASIARQEIGSSELRLMPYMRATVLESLRLWPTTPLVLRESTATTTWRNGSMPSNTGLVIFAPFFHRDNERLPFADRFYPELWIKEEVETATRALIPFSEGAAMCPGRQLVLFLTSRMLAELLRTPIHLQNPGRLSPAKPLPGTLNHFRLRFKTLAVPVG